MPLAALSFQVPFFLCLVQVLASLPTDPYFYAWREDPLVQHPRELWGQRNTTGEGFGYEYDRRVVNPREEHRGVGIYPQGGFERQYFQVRSFEESATEGYLNGGNFGNSYSSHVKCGDGGRKNVRTDVLGSEGVRRMDERINFQEASRTMRSETSKEVPNARIVNSKGPRRPPQGNSGKHDNKPPNAISTTEKASGNQTTKGSKRPRPGPAKPPGGDIVFPDVYSKKFIPRVTKCAKKSTFCEHPGEQYPVEHISQVLRREGVMFREFFGQDMISDPNITERINAPEENSLCPYRQEVVFPRVGQNKEDKWLFIVNQDQYVQGVTVEVCLNPESRCILTEGFPLGYTPYCKQKYIERRLVAIGEDGKPLSDSFRLPSCCSCVVKHETTARMAPIRPPRSP